MGQQALLRLFNLFNNYIPHNDQSLSTDVLVSTAVERAVQVRLLKTLKGMQFEAYTDE
jgi:hypothetical protein